MIRAPFQVLVLPFRRRTDGEYEFAVFCRSDSACWQGIADGGEGDETPLQAAKREAAEEGGIPVESSYLALDAVASVPATSFRDSDLWGDEVYVIPEYAFGVDVGDRGMTLSSEHAAMNWLTFAEAERVLTYDSNRVALWDLKQKVRGVGPRERI